MSKENTSSSALIRLLESTGSKSILDVATPDLGLAEHRPYPFMAIVGQVEMRTALVLSVINPDIGGVLLIGPRGTGKTTAVRSITGILPDIEISDCEEGILPADLEHPDAKVLYPDCYERHEKGEAISHFENVRLVELPLNARLEDVVGGINERVAVQRNAIRLERGILARADRNLLYVDEVNLLEDQIVDAILDAAAQGNYTVRRGAMSGTYRARFVLIGSMNPEEGRLRPQIMDRFGLRVNVGGLTDKSERLEVYKRNRAYRKNPTQFIHQWEMETIQALEDIFVAREILAKTIVDNATLDAGLELVQKLEIDSVRAEYTMFEAARAMAAADGRTEANLADLRIVAPMALRQRRSPFMVNFFEAQQDEDQKIRDCITEITGTLE